MGGWPLVLLSLTLAPGCRVERAKRHELREVSQFYRAQGDRGRPRQAERVYVLRVEAVLVGAVRLLARCPEPAGPEILFLRSLCIDTGLRRRGLGTWLAREAVESEGIPTYCFAYAELTSLYEAAGFSEVPRAIRPGWLRDHFESIQLREGRRGRALVCMSRGLELATESAHGVDVKHEGRPSSARPPLSGCRDVPELGRQHNAALPWMRGENAAFSESSVAACDVVRVVLLQHSRELHRLTATGPLLAHPRITSHLEVRMWTWSGRADNEHLQRRLEEIQPFTLLWTDNDAPRVTSIDALRADGADTEGVAQRGTRVVDEQESAPGGRIAATVIDRILPSPMTYVLLDGTWQEARAIYRKGPSALRRAQRLALAPNWPSRYTLRRDRGWRSRFSGSDDSGDGLLCTAECVAVLLENVIGDVHGAKLLLELLVEFQEELMSARRNATTSPR